MAKAKTKKPTEKLTPIPKHKPRGRAGATRKVAPATPKVAQRDLSYIPGKLRNLAWPVDQLQFHPRNPRRHSEDHIAEIAASLRVNGFVKNLVASTRTTPPTVVCGNGSLRAALSLGWTHVPVERLELTEAQENQLAIVDNIAGSKPDWDDAMLAELLKDVNTKNDERLDAMLADLAKEQGLYAGREGEVNDAEDPGAQIDRAAELQKKWRTEAGQLWEVPSKATPGKCHRILCGDSTKPEDVARVMGKEKALLCNTDPPYGVAYSDEARVAAERAHGRPQRKEKWADGIENDALDGDKLQEFLEAAIRAAVPHLADNAAFYLWHPMLTQGTFFAAAAAAADILIHRQIIWCKPSLLFGFGDYHWQHELCFYGWRRGHRPEFYGERNQTTLWDMRGDPNGDRLHPTQKPVELFLRPIKNHTKPGELVYEPFSGSGSQFVAAEQTGRLCYGIELAPQYVAVALERLAGMGLEPRLAKK